jgi:hypothetical protein
MLFPLLATIVSVTLTPSPTPAKNIDIQNIREVVQQKVQEKLKQISSPYPGKKAYLGTIIQLSSNEIIIDYQNSQKTLKISSETVFIDTKSRKIKFTDLKLGQDILALGFSSPETPWLDAKRIIIIDLKTIRLKYQVISGKIVDLSRTSPIFTLVPFANLNNQLQIKTDTKTSLLNKLGQNIDLKQLAAGKRVAAIIPIQTNLKSYLATQIILLDPTPTD